MDYGLIAVSFLTVAVVLLWTAYRTHERRTLILGAGVLGLVAAAHAAWLAWATPREPAPPSTPATSGQRLITIHGFDDPPPVAPRVVTGEDTPEQIIGKMGCGVCHQIPGVAAARSGMEGPLLIAAETAARRLASAGYRRALTSGRAGATTPSDYLVESILRPSAFIVPGFEQRGRPDESAMPDHFGTAFTPAGLERLVEYLLRQGCESAGRDRLNGPLIEPVEVWCPPQAD
jgi:hypothetical protein